MFSKIDDYVLHLAGAFAGRHELFDKFVINILDRYSFKLLPLTAMLIYIWSREDEKRLARTAVVEAVAGTLAAVAVSRLIQNLSPLRLRPLHSGNPAFVAPIGTNTETLEHWSSFPSDHAALSFALSTAIWHFSRPLGALSYAWSVLIVCLPRIYAGYHYASDALGGAVVGVGAVLCVRLLLPTEAVAGRASSLAARYPGPFNAAMFILMFFFTTMFEDIRLVFYALLKRV